MSQLGPCFSLWWLTLTLTLICLSGWLPFGQASDYCSSLDTARKMFMINKVVYLKISNGKFVSYNVNDKRHHFVDAHKLTGHGNSFTDISIACHFDPYEGCSQTVSNIDFCRYSRVYYNLVMIVGKTAGETEKSMQMFVLRPEDGTLGPYVVKAHTSSTKSSILPAVTTRIYAAMVQLFKQVRSNPSLKFTGLAYNEFQDTFFMSASVLDDTIANSESWGLGKHVLFGINFSQIGMMQDPVYLHTFSEPVSGLIDYNGQLYALSGKEVLLIDTDNGKELHRFDLKSFFGCVPGSNSPLTQPAEKPQINRVNMDDNFAKLNHLSFPWFGPEINVVESSLLVGFNFYAIVAGLTVLLVLIVAIDGVIIYKMSKSKQEEGAFQNIGSGSGKISSRRSSLTRQRTKSTKSGGKSKTRSR